jgi:hypothetical protein
MRETSAGILYFCRYYFSKWVADKGEDVNQVGFRSKKAETSQDYGMRVDIPKLASGEGKLFGLAYTV